MSELASQAVGTKLIIRAYGTPRPQGSKTRGAAGQMREASQGLPYWRDLVKLAAMRARIAANPEPPYWPTITGPARITRTYYLPRPAQPEHELFTLGRPDGDKLDRATGDALKDAGVYADDALIVEWAGRKLWSTSDNPPGVLIEIEVLP